MISLFLVRQIFRYKRVDKSKDCIVLSIPASYFKSSKQLLSSWCQYPAQVEVLLDSNALLPSGCRSEPSAVDLQTLHLDGLDVWTAWFHTTPTASYSVVWRGLCHLLFVVESTSHFPYMLFRHSQAPPTNQHIVAHFPIRIWVSTMKYCHPFFHQPMGIHGAGRASTLHKRAQSLWRAWPEGSRAKALRA